METVGRYDSASQMFIEEAREPGRRRLTLLRWLMEHICLEHPVMSLAGGRLVTAPVEDAIVGLPLASY